MSAYKDFLLGVEELVFEAVEKGFKDTDGVYAYVYMYEKRADKATVQYVLEQLGIGGKPDDHGRSAMFENMFGSGGFR
jgi:hypothetical protein